MKQIYCIPKLNQISQFLSFSKENNAGFEYNDFFIPAVLDNDAEVDRLVNEYLALDRDRSQDTLHGVFLDICVNSTDSLIYRASDYRIHQSMDIASRLGCKAVVFHTNMITNFKLQSYMDGWLKENIRYWKALLAEYPKLQVYVENMFDEDPILLRKLAEAMVDEPRFGVCFDLAHAFIGKAPMDDWIRDLSPYAKHLHINDNNGIEDTHHPVGSKNIPWDKYNQYLDSLPEDKKPTVLIEVRTYEDLTASVEYMKEHHMYPFQ